MAFIDRLWPALQRAMAWVDGDGDSNRDGFVDYAAARATGLVNQGWKDSGDSVFHADGQTPEGPIALVEVQGYVYAARDAMARLAERRGDDTTAERMRRQASLLREAVERTFWIPDIDFYAMALDGRGRPCRVRGSNAGQLLYTRLPAPERAAKVAEQLLSASFNDGWGIRTLAHGEARFNPMSYHNGSVWPHDTAVAAAGLARYGLRAEALRVLGALFDVSRSVDLNRLPELFCGFHRRPGEGPTRYPVACAPQAWAAAAVFLLLQACLGLSIRAEPPEVCFTDPRLPEFLHEVRLYNLRVGAASVDLRLCREGGDVRRG